jgi:putative membrane protein
VKKSPDIQAEMEEFARERTDWARQRTLLTNERTFSFWIRTGLAAVVACLGIAHLLEFERWPPLTGVIGAMFILTGGGIHVVAL